MLVTTAAMCLALTIYHESRGEPKAGQTAVGMVALNRAGGDDSKVCDVVFAKNQWSWTRGNFIKTQDGWVILKPAQPTESKAWAIAQKKAEALLAGKKSDPTGGATHFHHISINPRWANQRTKTVVIGRHVFHRL
jgi:spore germination cell wall hydrolase CwlJ-like protein